MTRLDDWEWRLRVYLAQDFAFEWGSMDCALFACGAVEAMTGVHPYPEFPGTYDDKIGAARALREKGKGTLEATFGQKFESIPAGFARRGDIVTEPGGAMGVCMGSYALFLAFEGGLVRKARAEFVTAWRVP